ncbi:MAG: site-specific integrase, partial [Bacteroidota bacterium]|nr:site-specific integrase [Bacteroidota bacterium]
MPVKLRKSKLKNGYSFYFDISYKGKRWTEWIKIHVKNSDDIIVKEENRKNIVLAKQMRSERDRELTVLGKGLPSEVRLREMDFFSVYDELCVPRIASAHICKNIRKKIKTYNGVNKPLPIAAIDKPWLAGFLAFLKREGMAGNTVHQYFAFMGTILREAMCLGYIVGNPHSLFGRHERPKLKRPKADHLTAEELDMFINTETKNIDEQLKQMFLLSCFTGLRWSDCQRVMWSNIRTVNINGQKQKMICLTQKKTKQEVMVPITASAEVLLEKRKKEIMADLEPQSLFIFPRWSSEMEKTKAKPLRTALSYFMRSWARQVEFPRRFKFHMARHTYATWLIQQGVDLYTVSKLLGHADMSATTIYAHVTDQVKLQAAMRLP